MFVRGREGGRERELTSKRATFVRLGFINDLVFMSLFIYL